MLLTIIHGLVSLGISAWFGYLFYTNLGPWFALIAIPLTVPIFYILYLLLLTILFLYAMLIKNKKAPQEPSRFYLWLVRQNDFLLMSVLRVKIVMRGKELLPKGQRFLIVKPSISSKKTKPQSPFPQKELEIKAKTSFSHSIQVLSRLPSKAVAQSSSPLLTALPRSIREPHGEKRRSTSTSSALSTQRTMRICPRSISPNCL